MAVTIPHVPFAQISARNLSCSETGGDFYDAVRTEDKLRRNRRVCGKGVSAGSPGFDAAGNALFAPLGGDAAGRYVGALNRFLRRSAWVKSTPPCSLPASIRG